MIQQCVVMCGVDDSRTCGDVQSEISELERTRESMARELVSVCIQNEDLTEKLGYHQASQQKYSVRQHDSLFIPVYLSH